MLLLRGGSGDGSSLGLGLMCLQLALLVDYIMGLVLLVVVLRPLARVLLLVLVNVLHLRTLGLRGCDGGGGEGCLWNKALSLRGVVGGKDGRIAGDKRKSRGTGKVKV